MTTTTPGREDRIITVVSTYATDYLPLANGSTRAQPGGPARYIGEALTRLGWKPVVLSGRRAHVSVRPAAEGEVYVISPLPPIPMPARLASPGVILSPISREIEPRSVPPVAGLLALDLQGFVRLPHRPTTELDREVDLVDLISRAAVVKGGSAELAALSAASRLVLRDRLMLETRGAAGLVLHGLGEPIFLASGRVAATNTIGAGDILLAAFVVALLSGYGPERAARDAVAFTVTLLRERASRV